MANKLSDALKFTNPRQTAEFDGWPSGTIRVKCKFYGEFNGSRGYRVCRETTDKHGHWCKPKKLTFAGKFAIADGSDGKTYILQDVPSYGFVHIWRHDFLMACESVFRGEPRYEELMAIIQAGQPPAPEPPKLAEGE